MVILRGQLPDAFRQRNDRHSAGRSYYREGCRKYLMDFGDYWESDAG